MEDKAVRACMEILRDRQTCERVARALALEEELRLVRCAQERGLDECHELCLERCRERGHPDCGGLCARAVGYAGAQALAREILLAAARLAAAHGLALPDAIIVAFMNAVQHADRRARDCAARERLAGALTVAADELADTAGHPELVMLAAPALALLRNCRERLERALEALRLLGEDIAARVAAALEEGAAVIGRAVVRFPPVPPG
jgi:hypothetical protein